MQPQGCESTAFMLCPSLCKQEVTGNVNGFRFARLLSIRIEKSLYGFVKTKKKK